MDEYLRLKENNGKDEGDTEGEKEEKAKEEEIVKKDNCDKRDLSQRRRSPRKNKESAETSSKPQEQSSAVFSSVAGSLEVLDHGDGGDQNSSRNDDSDPELPAPVPVLPTSAATSVTVTDVPKAASSSTESGHSSAADTSLKDETIEGEKIATETHVVEKVEQEYPKEDLFAVAQNAGKSGGRKKLNRISVDQLDVPPTPPRRSSRRRPPSESPSKAPQPSSARSSSPNKSPSKRKARKSRHVEDEDEDDDEPSALHPAQLHLPSPLKVEVSSKTDGKPPPQTSLPPFEATVSVVPLSQKHHDASHEEPLTSALTCSTDKSAPLKICLASGFTALTEKIGPGPAPVAHSDLEPHVESQEEKEHKERKRQEDKKFLEEEKKRLEEEKEILKQKVLEKKKRDEEREVKKSGDAPTRKGAADFFDIIFSEADEELKQAEVETAPEKSANEETRTLKIFGSAENVEKEKVIEQRRIKRISLDKEGEKGEEELKCSVCTLEKKCSVCELQEKPPSRPSSRAERVLRQEKWRRERSGERELSSKREDERQLRREEREAKRREKMQRSKEMSCERRSSYLTELMKEGRMRCDEEGPTAKVTRMDGRIRVQDNITPEKRKDNK